MRKRYRPREGTHWWWGHKNIQISHWRKHQNHEIVLRPWNLISICQNWSLSWNQSALLPRSITAPYCIKNYQITFKLSGDVLEGWKIIIPSCNFICNIQFHFSPWKCRSWKTACSGYLLIPVQNLTLEMDSSSSPGSNDIQHFIFLIKITPVMALWKTGPWIELLH